MARYERLSVIDRTFLDIERGNYPQHVAVTMIFEGGSLLRRDGGIAADRIRDHLASRLHKIPRYRQKIAWIPLENHPVWVDDDRFNLDYHVRHSSLPEPGDERQLKRLAGRIMSQKLDRGKPLWEVWVVEGLEGDRFALITKSHHCMIDGIAGVDLMAVLLSPTPNDPTPEPVEWIREPVPSAIELAGREFGRRLTTPLRALGGLNWALRNLAEARDEFTERVTALREALASGMNPASETLLNRPVGPHRRFDWLTFELEHVKAVKNRLGGTVNDVVLATVAGALTRFLVKRGIPNQTLQRLDFRAMVPVSMRAASQRGTTGNQIALWAVSLPLGSEDARARLANVREVTETLKHSRQALGAEVLAAVSEWTVPTLLSTATRAAYRMGAANLVVTNVPGPQIPLYMLGSRMLDTYPMLNLLTNHTLGVALFSYAGKLQWGLMADWDLVPDLHDFALALEESFAQICDVAEVKRATPATLEPTAERSEASL